MLANLRSYRPSHAVVVAYLALFVALGGSSYAAISITGKNVKNSSLTGKDVKNNSLTGTDIKSIKSGDVSDQSLLAKDFKVGQLPAGPQGPKGDKGDSGQGLKGDKGDAGERGPSDAYAVTGLSPLSLPAGDYVVSAKVEFDSTGGGALAGRLDCNVNDGVTTIDSAKQSYPAGGFATVNMFGQVHLAAAGTLNIGCGVIGEGSSTGVRIEAIKVAALH